MSDLPPENTSTQETAPVLPPPSDAMAAQTGAPVVSDLPPPVTPPPKKSSPAPTLPTPPAANGNGGGGKGGLISHFTGKGGGGDDKGDDGAGAKMGFMDHLLELRHRLWVSALTLVISIVLAVAFYKPLFDIMRLPLDKVNNAYRADTETYAAICKSMQLPPGSDVVKLSSLDPLDTMMMVMWLGLGVGLLLSSPILLYEGWSFIAPGLREREKNAIRPVLLGGIVFFIAGASIAYFVLFPITMGFLVWLNLDLKVQPMWSVERYSSLLLTMMALCGLVCESPLVVGVLAKLGLVKASHLTKFWRPIVLGAFIAGSVLSPGTDVMSMLLFSALLLSLYVVSIVFAYVLYRERK